MNNVLWFVFWIVDSLLLGCWWIRLLTFHCISPQIGYMSFLVLFVYVILDRIKETPTWQEIYVIAFILTMGLEKIRQVSHLSFLFLSWVLVITQFDQVEPWTNPFKTFICFRLPKHYPKKRTFKLIKFLLLQIFWVIEKSDRVKTKKMYFIRFWNYITSIQIFRKKK